VTDFVDDPHAAIEGANRGTIVNLADHRARASRDAQLALVRGGPAPVIAALRERSPAPHLTLPGHHDVRSDDVLLRRLHGTLASAAERGPVDFPDLVLTPGVGARTVASLALVAEVIYGAPHRFSDPARFSFAHGGKDGHPFPVPLAVYDETIRVLGDAIARAKLGREERLAAIERLDAQARLAESVARGESWDALVRDERERSPRYRGRTVFQKAKKRPRGQLGLPGID
jgi:hypothetical protein